MDDSILQMFLEDTREHLTDIETDLLDIEEAGVEFDLELVNKVFRTAHSIKGSAAFLSLNNIKDLSHKIENVLDMVRSRQVEPTPEVVNVTLRAFDRLEEMIDDIQNSDVMDISEHVAALSEIVSEHLSSEELEEAATTVPIALPNGTQIFSVTEHDLKQARKGGNFIYLVEYDLIHDVHKKDKTPLELLKGLESSGRILDCRMDISTVGDLDGELSNRIPFYLLFATILESDLVKAIFQVPEQFIHCIMGDAQAPLSKDAQEEETPEEALFAGTEAEEPEPAALAQQEGNAGVLHITGTASISECPEWKEKILDSLRTQTEVILDLSGLTSTDLAFLQLLIASARSAEEKGIALRCQGEIPEALSDVANRAGIEDLRGNKVFKGLFDE